MKSPPTFTVAGVIDSSGADLRSGLLAWLTLTVNGQLMVDGVVLRRTRSGELALSYPERTNRHGRRYPVIRPLNDEARRVLENQVFEQLGISRESFP